MDQLQELKELIALLKEDSVRREAALARKDTTIDSLISEVKKLRKEVEELIKDSLLKTIILNPTDDSEYESQSQEGIANLYRNLIDQFLKRLIMCDEKWITYDNNMRKRSWSKKDDAPQTMTKPGLTPNKVVLCV